MPFANFVENEAGEAADGDAVFPGESEVQVKSPYPVEIDIGDGIERDIRIRQEIFGTIQQYGTEFEVMRFSLSNTGKDSITVQVMSLGAALTGITCPDRKGICKDVVLGFDDPQSYYSPTNPGFGRITSLCPLPYNLEKIVWDWDFDRDEGSVTFSTAFYKIDTILTVRYMLTACNEIVVDLKACGAKILPISLTSQVYWNMAGHQKGEDALKHHALSINSDKIWKHYKHNLRNFVGIADTPLDFRIPTLMDNENVFGVKNFEHVYVVNKGTEQKLAFLARLIHPRTCRYVEIYSDHPWMLCNTFNKIPSAHSPGMKNSEVCSFPEESTAEEAFEEDLQVCPSDESRFNKSDSLPEELKGKDKASYQKYSAFCITPLSDLSGFDPILIPGKSYSHRIIYKIGVYRRYMRPIEVKTEEKIEQKDKEDVTYEDVQDIQTD